MKNENAKISLVQQMGQIVEPNSAVSNLVVIEGAKVCASTLDIARHFGRDHKSILRTIKKAGYSAEFRQRNFAPTPALDSQGKPRLTYLVTQEGFALLALSFTGVDSLPKKESFINAFSAMREELERRKSGIGTREWTDARIDGKTDRRDLTDAVQLLCQRANERRESSAPLHLWMTGVTGSVTRILFDVNRESIKCVRDRLTAKQLRNLATAETIYANRITSLLTSDLKHTTIGEEAKLSVKNFCAAIGGQQVPGFDRLQMLAVTGEVAE